MTQLKTRLKGQKPPTDLESVFIGRRMTATRAKRIGSAATATINTLKHPRYTEVDPYEAGRARIERAQGKMSEARGWLYDRFEDELKHGVVLQATSILGNKITATGIKKGDPQYKGAAWRLHIEAADGSATDFAVGGDEGLKVINPETRKEYGMHRYGIEEKVSAFESAAVAMYRLNEAHKAGNLTVIALPAAISQQQPVFA